MVKRLLWVEDEPYALEDMVRPLKKSGYEITIASDAKDALNKMEKMKFDLILLDILIPSGSRCEGDFENQSALIGINLLKKLKSKSIQLPPVVVFSVLRDCELRDNLLDLNIIKIINKYNYLPSELKKDIEDILQ